MKTDPFTEGERIYYRGDMANDSGFGVVTFADSRRFTIRMEDGRELRLVPQGIVTFQRASEHEAERAAGLEQLRAAVRPKSTTEHHVGSRYVSGRDVATIAQLVRADISDAVKRGELPAATYRVRISRYSMGCSLTIQASGVVGALNRLRAEHDARHPHSPLPNDGPARLLCSEHGRAVEATLTALAAAYQRSDTDHQSDYYNTNFHLSVSVWTSGEMEALRADVAREIADEKADPPGAVVLPFPMDRIEAIRRETGRMPDDMPRPPVPRVTRPADDQAEWLAWLESVAVR